MCSVLHAVFKESMFNLVACLMIHIIDHKDDDSGGHELLCICRCFLFLARPLSCVMVFFCNIKFGSVVSSACLLATTVEFELSYNAGWPLSNRWLLGNTCE